MAEELLNIESIYDFIYLDNTKIKSFYAQITGNGSLTTIKESSSNSMTELKEATIGIPTITGGKLSHSETPVKSSERLYDGIPTMPREMIDKLDELGFIGRELKEDNLGRLVLLEGTLGVLDVGMLKEMIEPAINFYVKDLQKTNTKESRAEAKDINSLKAEVIQFLRSVPYALQSRLLVRNQSSNKLDEVWMTLNREELVVKSHDLNFKHGEFITGKWYLLGVLDALPNDDFVYENQKTEVQVGIEAILTVLRTFVGRATTSFGITPIAIFRNIEPHLED